MCDGMLREILTLYTPSKVEIRNILLNPNCLNKFIVLKNRIHSKNKTVSQKNLLGAIMNSK